MTEKEMMLFAYQQSPEPMIKNKVLRDALDKDLGPRNNFGDGGVTLITQGKNKGKYHLRLGSGENRKTHIGTKDNLDLIFKNRKTAGGDVMSRLDNVKNPKGYLTQSQFQTFLKENNINAESSGSSFAKNHGVNTKINPLQKNTLLYDTSQFTEEFIETVQKAQVKSGVGTEFARDKFPPKTKSDLNKIRQAEIEAQGGIKKNSPFAGKKKLKVDLGHTGDYKTELVTGDKLSYTPSKVNSEMGKKGNLDDKIRAVKKRQNKALETLEGDELKKILNETDATLTRLADQSSGFKSVVLSNGKKYGGDRLTIDPFNVYPGKTEVEIRNIQNKYSKKKIITEEMVKKNPKLKLTSAEEIQKIQDAYFFETNRKSNLKTASKIGKKEQIKIFKKMGFRCNKAVGGVEDVACYLDDVKKTKADARSSDVLKRAKALTKERKALQVAKTLPKVGNIIRKGVQVGAGAVSSVLSAVGLGPVGFAIEAAIEGGFYDNARRNGYTHEQAYAETFLPKLITDAAGTTNTNTNLFEGADAMIEKEKLGKEDSLASQFNNAQNIFDQEVKKLDNMVSSYMQMQASGMNKKETDAFLEKIYVQEDKVTNLIRTIKPGTPEYEAYQIAEETQTGRMENRKNEYLSMNRIPYIDAQGNMQEKTFPLSPAQIKQQEPSEFTIKQKDKERNKAMEEYKLGIDGVLEPVFLKENEKADWSKIYGDGPDQSSKKWKDIFEGDGAFDLTDKIGIAGGVANMAQGGLASLKRKL